MKNRIFLLIAIFGMMLLSCGQKSQKSTDIVNEQSQTLTDETIPQTEKETENTVDENLEAKFLITNNSAGHFKIGESWQDFAKNDYNYKSIQSYGTCVDACCDGGFDLGKVIVNGNYGQIIENPELTIGALIFDENESESAHKDNPNVFHVSSDNCSGWYWKDKISYLIVYSEAFKTKEGIGAGITLENVKEIFGNVIISIGWLEEDANAVQVKINSYPNIEFILDADDAVGGYEKLSSLGETATISDFKKNTKIKRLIIHPVTN